MRLRLLKRNKQCGWGAYTYTRIWVDYREIAGRAVENQYCSKTSSPPSHAHVSSDLSKPVWVLTFGLLFHFECEVATAKSVAKTTSRAVVLELKTHERLSTRGQRTASLKYLEPSPEEHNSSVRQKYNPVLEHVQSRTGLLTLLIFIPKLKISTRYSKSARCHTAQYDQHYTQQSAPWDTGPRDLTQRHWFHKSALSRRAHWQDCSSRLLNCKLLMSGEEFPPFAASLSSSVLTFQIHRRSLSTKSSPGVTGCQIEAWRSSRT